MATPSFGEKLRQERERRNTSIEEIAERTKIALHFLQALERDDFDELPGRAFGKFYIRAYAEVLDFDPGPLIVEYDKEQTVEGDAPGEVTPAEPTKPRRVEAEIARWREARLSGQRPSTEMAEDGESDEATEADSPSDDFEVSPEILDTPAPVPVSDREGQGAGARYDEAAALASILGAHDPVPTASRRRRFVTASVVGIGLLAVLGWVIVSLLMPDADVAENRPTTASEESHPVPPVETTTAPKPVAPTHVPTPAPAPASASADQSTLEAVPDSPTISVSEFGVGRRIVNRRLEDRGQSFEEGSVVWFQTRVVGGARGEKIRHVWLRDGRVVQTVDLELGASHWRTHSRKTLWGTGDWAVEARDRQGRVLARSDFVCVPAG